jgi:hypothetical protein
MPNSAIPFSVRKNVLESLLPLGERLFSNSEKLQRAGFTAYLPLLEDSVAGCSKEQQTIHWRFLIEAAKEEIGNGDLPGVVLWGVGPGYKSELLSDLRRSRDTAGYDRNFFHENNSEHWKCWLSPCWIERWRIAFEEPQRHIELLNLRNSRFREERLKESTRFSLFDKAIVANELRAYGALAKQVLEDPLLEIGFRFRKHISKKQWSVWSSFLCENWELRLGVEISDHTIKPHLFACHSDLRKNPIGWPSLYHSEEYVEILFEKSALEFSRTYRRFESLSELEINLRAFQFLLKLEHEFVRDAVLTNL